MNFKIVTIVFLLTAASFVFWFLFLSDQKPDSIDGAPTELPSGSGLDRGNPVEPPQPGSYGSGEGGTLEILVNNSESVVINDVRIDTETYSMGNGNYSLTGFLNNTPETQFNITFTETDGSFAVALLEEPLAESRKAAENFLVNKLNVSPEVLCSLSVYVGVPVSINSALSNENLGISFCPGAFPLE